MRFLGLEITVRRAGRQSSPFPSLASNPHTPRPFFLKSSGSGYSQVILPEFDTSDPFLSGRMQHLAQKIQKMFTNGWVDVSTVVDIVNALNLSQTAQTMQCIENLRTIHCVDFKDLDPDLVVRIPYMINHIFSEGRLPDHPVHDYGDRVRNLLA